MYVAKSFEFSPAHQLRFMCIKTKNILSTAFSHTSAGSRPQAICFDIYPKNTRGRGCSVQIAFSKMESSRVDLDPKLNGASRIGWHESQRYIEECGNDDDSGEISTCNGSIWGTLGRIRSAGIHCGCAWILWECEVHCGGDC